MIFEYSLNEKKKIKQYWRLQSSQKVPVPYNHITTTVMGSIMLFPGARNSIHTVDGNATMQCQELDANRKKTITYKDCCRKKKFV